MRERRLDRLASARHREQIEQSVLVSVSQVPMTSELTKPAALPRCQVATHTSVLMASAVAALWEAALSSGFCLEERGSLPGGAEDPRRSSIVRVGWVLCDGSAARPGSGAERSGASVSEFRVQTTFSRSGRSTMQP